MTVQAVNHAGVSADRVEKPESGSSRAEMWDLLGRYRWHLVVACVIQAIAAAASVVPFIAVASLAKLLLASETASASEAWFWGWIAVGSFLLRAVLEFIAGALTHYADLDFQLDVRRRLADRLLRAPLGWFTLRSAGEIKKGIGDDVLAMHHLVAHDALNWSRRSSCPS